MKTRSVQMLPVLLTLVACSESGTQGQGVAPQVEIDVSRSDSTVSGVISGEAWYRERIALPPGAVFTVTLEDVSRMDVAATVIAEISRELETGPPYAFELHYEPSAIDNRMRYSVRAQIYVEDNLRFTSTESINPFAGKGEPLDILMSAVGASPPVGAAVMQGDQDTPEIVSVDPLAELEGSRWVLQTIGNNVISVPEAEERVAFLELNATENQASGSGSCNNFNGSYEFDGNKIRFGPLAATMMACINGMEVEQDFFEVLDKTRHFSITGNSLTLYAENREPIAVLAAN